MALALAGAAAAAAPWQLEPAGGRSEPARATVDNTAGETLAVFRDTAGTVYVEFTTSSFEGLAADSCPTFQIDARIPLHFYPIGEQCAVNGRTARYRVAAIEARRTESLPLYRLMNGTQVAFRYQSQDGTYHESRFSLRASKRAVLGALGRDLAVDPGLDE